MKHFDDLKERLKRDYLAQTLMLCILFITAIYMLVKFQEHNRLEEEIKLIRLEQQYLEIKIEHLRKDTIEIKAEPEPTPTAKKKIKKR